MSLFVLAGEPSGDLHGHRVLQALRRKDPALKIEGIGGPKMQSEGLKAFLSMEEFQMLGFISIIRSLPKLKRCFHKVLSYILETRPSAVLFIDYPGFNLRMAKALREKGYKGKLIQYICPQIWLWFKSDIKKMTATLDLLLVIFPFELPFFEHSSLPIQYVGHPCLEILDNHTYTPHKELFPEAPILGIFPGSRLNVIKRNFPLQLQAARQLQKEHPDLCIAISVANPQAESIIRPLANKCDLLVSENHSYDLMRASKLAIATNGTVCLELALHETPTVVTSAYSYWDSFIAKYFFGVKQPCCIVNILTQNDVFPELLYKDHTLENIISEIRTIYESKLDEKRSLWSRHIKDLLMSTQHSSEHVASSILNLLH
jgi:lipid-A-disaccharide synthase